jgi:hypothetical protein
MTAGKFLLALLVTSLAAFSFWSSLQNKSKDYQQNNGYKWEQYDPSYFLKYQTVQDIIDTADNQFAKKDQNTIPYFNFIAGLIRKRFYHGYSSYSLAENPLAFLSGRLIWNHLSAVVIADDILKYPMAACSQQAIVLAAIFKARGIDYRKICFPNHFAIEGFIEGEWRYFDTNMEPDIKEREPIDSIMAKNKFNVIYRHVPEKQSFKRGTAYYSKGQVNEVLAPNATLFHRVTGFISSPFKALSIMILLLIYYNWPNILKLTTSTRFTQRKTH